MSTVVVADPGFPRWRGGEYQRQRWGQKPIIWPEFCQKLHANERN